MLTNIASPDMKFKTCAFISVASLVATHSWSATESTASSTAKPAQSMVYFTPSFYPAENEWLVTGGLIKGNAPIDTVTKILGRADATSNMTEHSTIAASSLRYGLSKQSELMISVTYLAETTSYQTSWSMPQLAYTYRIAQPDSLLKSNLTAIYIPRSLYESPFSGPARYKLGGGSSYEVAPESWVNVALEYRVKSSEKFPAYALINSNLTKAFSSVVVSAGISAKKQEEARPNLGSRSETFWVRGVNLGVAQKIDNKQGLTFILSHEKQNSKEVLDSGYGSVALRIKSTTATVGYYQAF